MEHGDGEMDGLTVSLCARCPQLVDSRSQIVNGVGPPDANLLIVGEAPGADEDRQGEPFVGRSGELLTEYMQSAGITREAVRITNSVRCRPPENRDPRTDELTNCRGWLEREITLVNPTVVLALGKVPASNLLARDVAVTAECGRIEQIEIGDRRFPVVICVHPAAILYDRSQIERLENALAVAARRLGIVPPEDDQSSLEQFTGGQRGSQGG